MITEQRMKVIPHAHGRVLEIGAGAGANFALYDPAKVSEVVAIEPSAPLRKQAAAAAHPAGLKIDVRDAVGENLPFEDASFDTVVTTYTLCSVGNEEKVLAELRRVLKPGGTLLFLEHGRAPDAPVLKWQKRIEPLWKRAMGNCHLTRPVSSAIAGAGFKIEESGASYLDDMPRWAGWTEWGSATNA